MVLSSIEQAAGILNICRTTAYRLATQRRLPCVRSFGPLRMHAEKLLEMIEAEALF
ncbi:helix-turn-helix domain-containing protein [Pseudomonas sp. S9]|uniref:helix-turn-helix domain-containing protein n=1 Tax=Pseudomonas sp. S9 TaxID=686578 RepID=UPI00025574C3